MPQSKASMPQSNSASNSSSPQSSSATSSSDKTISALAASYAGLDPSVHSPSRFSLHELPNLPKVAAVNTIMVRGRGRWPNKINFWLSCLCGASSLANIWRFPYLVNKYKGAAFLVPYFVALLVIGLPLLTLELTIGQMFQGGVVDSFGSLSGRLRGVGVAAALAGFITAVYHGILLAWTAIYFVKSFDPTHKLPWNTSADAWLQSYVLKNSTIDGTEMVVSGRVLLAAMACWFIVFLCASRSFRSISVASLITFPLSFLAMAGLIVRGVFLDGAVEGLKNYIANWDTSILTSIELWSEATGHVIYSLSIGSGVYSTYSSFNSRSQNIALDKTVIGMMDVILSVMGGAVVYLILGYLHHHCPHSTEICTQYFNEHGINLVFKVYADALSGIAAPTLWGALFYGMIFLVLLGTLFSLTESVATVIRDSWIASSLKLGTKTTAFYVSLVALFFGVPFMFDCGSNWVAILDYYNRNWIVIYVALLQAIGVGWIYKSDRQYRRAGRTAVLCYDIGCFCTIAIPIIVGLNLVDSGHGIEKSRYIAFGLAAAIFISSLIAAYILMDSDKVRKTKRNSFWTLIGWHGADNFRKIINSKPSSRWFPNNFNTEFDSCFNPAKISIVFGFCIKYAIPGSLLALLIHNIHDNGFKHSSGYTNKQLLLGYIAFGFVAFASVFVFIFPRTLSHPNEVDEQNSLAGQLEWVFTARTAKKR